MAVFGFVLPSNAWNQKPSGFGHHLAWRSNSLEAASHFRLGSSVTSWSWIQSAWVLLEAEPNSYAPSVLQMWKIGKETIPCMCSCSFLHCAAVHVKAGWSNTTRTFDLSVFLHFSSVYQERLLVFDLKRAQRRALPGRSQAHQCPASTIIVLVLSSANNKVDQKASKRTLLGKKAA